MHTRSLGWITLILLAYGGCGDDADPGSGSDARRDGAVDAATNKPDAAPHIPEASDADSSDAADAPGDEDANGGVVVECMRGGEVSVVHVEFRCGEITVYTCKDLSNVVIEYADGTRQRIMGLNGHVNHFSGTGPNAGISIVGVWVKAGDNKSGDGPGYGERVDAPPQTCTPPTGGRGGSGGAGNGGTGGTCVSGPDVSCQPIPTSGTGGGGGTAGAAGSAGQSGPRPD